MNDDIAAFVVAVRLGNSHDSCPTKGKFYPPCVFRIFFDSSGGHTIILHPRSFKVAHYLIFK
jgi:hypothetical protein